MKIVELQDSKAFDGLIALVETFAAKEDKNGNLYGAMKLRDPDKTTIEARLWDYDKNRHEFLKEGVVVEVRGKTSTWQGKQQISVNRIIPSDEPVEQFVKSSVLDIEKTAASIEEIIDGFEDEFVKAVSKELWSDLKEDYCRAPAAKKVHNAWRGGLIEHSWALCKLAMPTIEYYNSTYKCSLSSDRVLFGCIFHDLGKIGEYDFSTPNIKMDPVGLLTPHIVEGIGKIYEIAAKHKDKAKSFEMERAQLVHLVAAHHGLQEWGSPVSPSTLEAIVLHHIDNLDGSLMHAIEQIEDGDGDVKGFTERSWVEGRRFYRGDKD